MKQLICTLFIVLQLSAFSISAHSFEVDGLFYNIVDREVDSYMDNNVEVTFDQEKHTNKLGSYSGEINIPEMVTYNGTDYCVVGIGNEAFRYSNNLESIEYPSTIRYIGTSAFEGCEKVPLAPIIIASDDETHNTSIPYSVTYIGERAFAESGLEEVYCDDLSCAPAAFKDCKRLKTVAIHMSSIPSECFAGCSNLENLSNSFSKYIGEYAFAGCSSLTNNYVIMGYGLEDIDQYAFDGCTSLDRIDIPASVRSIGSYAFSRCTGLIEVYLNGVTLYNSGPKYCYKDLLFYDNVFNGCSSITSVHIGRRMVSDYKGTLTDPFRGLTLTSVRFTDFALETAFNGADYPELSSISSCTPIPPIIAGFTDSQYKTISIGIPSEYRAAYQQNSIWQKFSKMGSVSLASACIVEHDGLYYVTTWLGTDAMVIHNPYGKKYEKSSYTISEFEFNGIAVR